MDYNSILIKGGTLLNGKKRDILINQNIITQIQSSIDEDSADCVLDAQKKIILPGLLNGHTHAGMTLFRGYADDMPLHTWLSDMIWPLEAKMTEEDIYWGTKLACLEMIKSGTTFFSDMYWHWHGSAKAVAEMGLRGILSGAFIDLFSPETAKAQQCENEQLFKDSKHYPDRIDYALGPHAIYTVSEESLRWITSFASDHRLHIHIHVSETEKEVQDCIKKHGVRPVEYLKGIGLLGKNVVIAHGIWLNNYEQDILRDYQVNIITNPCANMKLATGMFPFSDIQKKGISIGIGTDSVASNNNFDLFEEMKVLALLEKSRTGNPAAAPAADVYATATENPAKIFGLSCGKIKEGYLADICLINVDSPALTPRHNLLSHLVYAAQGSIVDTVICDGKILMQNGNVEGEQEILRRSEEVAMHLLKR